MRHMNATQRSLCRTRINDAKKINDALKEESQRVESSNEELEERITTLAGVVDRLIEVLDTITDHLWED